MPSLAVPCAEERNPLSGRRPAIAIKFTLGLQLVCRKQKKFAQSLPVSLHTAAKSYIVTEMLTSEDTKQQKKFTLVQKKITLVQNKFTFLPNKFTF